jgi:hypothetical protein
LQKIILIIGKIKRMKNNAPRNKQDLSPEGEVKHKAKKINSRNKGHTAEVKYARVFREELGFGKCKTSRQASRLLDDSKVDLANIPFNVQIKKGYWKSRPKADEIFKSMKKCLNDNFLADDPQISHKKVLIHELDGHADEHCLVTMMWKEWVEIIKVYNKVKYNIDL